MLPHKHESASACTNYERYLLDRISVIQDAMPLVSYILSHKHSIWDCSLHQLTCVASQPTLLQRSLHSYSAGLLTKNQCVLSTEHHQPVPCVQ